MKLLVSKMKPLATFLIFAFAGVLFAGVLNAQEKFILTVTEFTVKNGHEKLFEDGVKEWKDCYLENGGEWEWQMWKRSNGKGSVYALSSRMANWAELDEMGDEAGKKCIPIALQKIVPHVEYRERNYYSSMPDISRAPTTEMGVIWVTFFDVKNSGIFRKTVDAVNEVMKETEGDARGYWYSAAGGGPKSPSYFVSTPFKNFAALDEDRDGVWKMMEKAKGKEATDKMRDEFRSSVNNIWSYLYKRMDDHSHFSPPEE